MIEYDLGDRIQINAVDLLAYIEKLTLPSFKVSVKMDREPKGLVNVTKGKELPFSYKNGLATFSIRGLIIFDMYEFKY